MAEGSGLGWTGVEGDVRCSGWGQWDATKSKHVDQSCVRKGALLASETGGPYTASLDVLRLADGGIPSEAAHCLSRIGEAVVFVMDGNCY